MEDALARLCTWLSKQQYPCVLILVLMEDALARVKKEDTATLELLS